MRQTHFIAVAASAIVAVAAAAQIPAKAPPPARSSAIAAPIAAAVADPQRAAANRARDPYRHPAETLAFFGVKPTDTVVEFSPGGGWYTEILAPLVKGKGKYVALTSARGADGAQKMIAAKATWFGTATVATIDTAAGTTTLPPGGADVVLTFRNVHNLIMGDNPAAGVATFKAFYAALKPGGTLGVVDHRLPEAMDTAKEKTSGYLKRSTVVKLAEAAGFKSAGESEINANAKDTHDHPEGVWTLPPTLELKDVDRAKYVAIGESDRMTLKFVRPK